VEKYWVQIDELAQRLIKQETVVSPKLLNTETN